MAMDPSGESPAYRVSVTPLSKDWKVLRGETEPAYQSMSGSLHWQGELHVQKDPEASPVQCLRLNLSEINRRDENDETVIGAAIVSLSDFRCIKQIFPLCIAFFVYDSCSLYDHLSSSALLMKDASIRFVDVTDELSASIFDEKIKQERVRATPLEFPANGLMGTAGRAGQDRIESNDADSSRGCESGRQGTPQRPTERVVEDF